MSWWQKALIFLLAGFTLGYITKDNFTKPDEVNNIENKNKIKKNNSPVDVTSNNDINTSEVKDKKKFRLFKKRKNDRKRKN